jgi:glycolate oxidase FAD binding subunit
VPPARWGQLPTSSVVIRVSFWVSSLGAVLEALAAAAADAGVRPAASGPAGAGALYACLDPGTSEDDAARFVAILRERIGGIQGARGSVVVLAAPPPVLEAVSATGMIPGVALMRAVKDQFDPGHRMFPGRLMEGS